MLNALLKRVQAGDVLKPVELRSMNVLQREVEDIIQRHREEAQAQADQMNERQTQAFEHFERLGPMRSLAQTSKELNIPYNSIRRWSCRFKWIDLIDRHARELAEKARKELDATYIEAKNNDLKTCLSIKSKFLEDLTNGKICISVSDWARVCQEERLIRAELGQTKGDSKVDKKELVTAFLAALEAGEAPPERSVDT